MEGVVKLENNICHGCISQDRQLNSIGEYYELFSLLTGGGRCLAYSADEVKFCCECLGKLKKCRIFQLQLMEAQDSLIQMLYGMGAPQPLSHLTTKITSNIDIEITEIPKEETIPSIDKTDIKIKTEISNDKFGDEMNTDDFNVFENDFEVDIKYDDDDLKNDDIDTKNDKKRIKTNDLNMKNDYNGIFVDNDFSKDSEFKSESLLTDEKKFKRNKRKVECFRQWKEKHRNIYKENAEEITVEQAWGNINDHFTLTKFDESQLEEHVLVNERKFTDPKKYKHYCYACKLGYRSLRDYTRHNDLNHMNTKSFKCSVCKEVSKCHADFVNHWREHSVIAQCKMCNKYMKTHGMKQHLNMLHLDRFACKLCSMTFHVIAQCKMCNKYMKTHGMKQHLNMLHLDRFACKSCSMTFQSLKRFGIHYRKTHMNYICDHCKMTFKCKIRLAKHIQISHMPIHCKDCNRRLANERQYRNHCTIVHPEKVNKEVSPELRFCVECDKQFHSAAAYTKHLQDSVRHTQKRPKKATCPECGKVFHKITNMKNHYNLYHLKKTNNYCQICDKYYARASGLRKHYDQVHLKLKMPRNVICDICGRFFTTKRIMLNHRATHTGERAHSCLYCNATFIQKYAMQTHMKTQHKHYT